MSSKLFTAVFIALCAAPVAAQSFNLDFGEPTAGPSSSYGAAGLPGFWNAIHGDGSDVVLKNLAGVATSVHFWQAGAAGLIAASDPALSGDDALLMNDGLITHTFGLDSCFYFNGLEAGTYELITYAWRPNTPTLMAKSFVDNTAGVEISGGAWPGGHVHGVTFARHIVTVTASHFMGPHSGLAAGADTVAGAVCNGMQLRKIDPPVAFCFGDGSLATACPCGNYGAPGNGCANSVNPSGALLTSSGSTNPDTVVLQASGMPAVVTLASIYLQGDALVAGGIVFGDGVRCAGGNLIRLGSKATPSGSSQYPESGNPSVSTKGLVTPGSGVTRYYQTYYRNSSTSFCPPATFNVTNGLIVVW